MLDNAVVMMQTILKFIRSKTFTRLYNFSPATEEVEERKKIYFNRRLSFCIHFFPVWQVNLYFLVFLVFLYFCIHITLSSYRHFILSWQITRVEIHCKQLFQIKFFEKRIMQSPSRYGSRVYRFTQNFLFGLKCQLRSQQEQDI